MAGGDSGHRVGRDTGTGATFGRRDARAEELARREEALREAAAVLDAFEALPSPAALVRSDGTVRAANAAWRAEAHQRPDLVMVGDRYDLAWRTLTGPGAMAAAVAGVLRGDLERLSSEQTLPVSGDGAERALLVQLQGLDLPDGEHGLLAVHIDMSEQRRREQQLLHDATHDHLTGLGNRALLVRRLEVAIERQRRYGVGYGLLYLDLDGFKGVNDRFGHVAGDELLREVGQRWRPLVRSPDVMARVGGDEFVVLVEQAHDDAPAHALAARLVAALAEPVTTASGSVHVEVTVGVALPTTAQTPAEALTEADAAMYRRKDHDR